MAIGGGKGNSEKQTRTDSVTNTKQETINTVDNRAVQGDNAAIGGNVTVNPGESSQIGALTISTTDQGAVHAGLDIALQSLGGIQEIADRATRAADRATRANASVASDSIAQAYGLANQARQSETSGALNNFLKYGAIVVVIGLIAWAVVKARK